MLQAFLREHERDTHPRRLFPGAPTVSFRSMADPCPRCGHPAKVKKTQRRTVLSLALGRFVAHEWICACAACGHEGSGSDLDRIVAPGGNFAYDVMVYAGMEMFVSQRNACQVRDSLVARGLPASESEIRWLGRRFLAYLSVAHRHATPGIKAAMAENGGYILHLDGTTDGQAPVLFCAMDELLQIVLSNIKLVSEDSDLISPFLREIKERFGSPLALVHDMGRGILKAVATVFPGVPDFICHFHFLRDAGKDLLEADYDRIRKGLRRHGVTAKLTRLMRALNPALDRTQLSRFNARIKNSGESLLPRRDTAQFPSISAYCLAAWVMGGKHQGGGYGFPFDRTHVVFLQRIRLVYEQLDSIRNLAPARPGREVKTLHKLLGLLHHVANDPGLKRDQGNIERKIKIFDELRGDMAIAPVDSIEGLRSPGAIQPLATIQNRVHRFCARHAENLECNALIAQIQLYENKLFADPISVITQGGGTTQIQPQRTNNLMEQRFRATRRDHRRRTGNNTMGAAIRGLPANVMLAANLKSPQYLRILLGDHTSLDNLFGSLPKAEVTAEQRKSAEDPEKIPAAIRDVLDLPALPATVIDVLRKAVFRKSN